MNDRRRTLNRLLFPVPTRSFEQSRDGFGDLSVLSTVRYFHGFESATAYEVEIEQGKTLLLGLQSIGDP